MTTEPGGWAIIHTASGNVPAPTIEPSEMWRLHATMTTKTTSTAASGSGVQAQPGAHECGHGFSAAEVEIRGITMADHDGQGGRAHPGAVAAGEPAFQPYGQVTFTHIQQQGGYSGASAGGTQHVGGANIAAPGSAYVASRWSA